MFVPAGKEGRSLWFNKDCVWADEEYGLVGLLVGLAVYSGVILDVPLPLVVFKKVLGEQLSLKVRVFATSCSQNCYSLPSPACSYALCWVRRTDTMFSWS